MDNRLSRFVYDHSPVFLQNVFASCYGWKKKRKRYGPVFREWEPRFVDSQSWSFNDLLAFQNERLSALVQHAYEHTPFYRNRFKTAGLCPEDIREVADLPKLPLLEKDDIRHAGYAMLSDAYQRDELMTHPTSGSTGKPMTLYTGPDALQIEYAFMWARRRPGVRRGDPYASFTGLQLIDPQATSPPFWRNNWAANQRMYSVFHLSEKNLRYYVDDLNRRSPVYWEGYASPVYVIAEYMQRNGLRLDNPPKAFFSTSEVLHPHYRQTIASALDTRVWDMYGQGEFAASISEYPCGHMHYDMDYGVIEFIEAGCKDGLVKAEIVCTGLYNFAWPLIRYRVGDMVLYDPDDQPDADCGHQGRIIRKILGRTGEFFVLPDGRQVTNISVIAKQCDHIVTMQVIQDFPKKFQVVVQKAPGFTAENEKQIYQAFEDKLGPNLPMTIRYVNAPVLTRHGKFLSIVSRLKSTQPESCVSRS